MTTLRQYWVVSPNVHNDYHTVGEWRNASVEWKAAFIGWGLDHRLGRKFALEIQQGDVILIARRRAKEPETVGFGTVLGNYRTGLKGFTPPEAFQLLRRLHPFVPMSKPPKGFSLIEAVNQTAALHQLHPERNEAHSRICRWMDERLSSVAEVQSELKHDKKRNIRLGPLPNDNQLEYQIRTSLAARQARKREAELVQRYRRWLERQDRELQIFKTHSIQCDAYEEIRKNLVEAKCSTGRQHIRMAVGQLLDYEFFAREELGDCHKAILLPDKPEDSLLRWLKTLHISVVWEERTAFLDNANGQFM